MARSRAKICAEHQQPQQRLDGAREQLGVVVAQLLQLDEAQRPPVADSGASRASRGAAQRSAHARGGAAATDSRMPSFVLGIGEVDAGVVAEDVFERGVRPEVAP